MSSVFDKIHGLQRRFKLRPIVDIEIIIDVLESEIDHQELKKILKIDLSKEEQLRRILKKDQFARFTRLEMVCDKRKALLVMFKSIKLEKNLKELFLKTMFYPAFLFILSFLMLIFVNGILLRTFQSLLSFMGPDMNISTLELVLSIIMVLDGIFLISLVLVLILLKRNRNRLYILTEKLIPDNPWFRLVSHQFCLKFIDFYNLGESIDQILNQIRWSSDDVLSRRMGEMIRLLEAGETLNQAVKRIDANLEVYFRMSDEGLPIEKYLRNHNRIQELMLKRQITKLARTVLGVAYFQIAVIIVVIYQLMLKPIEMMGNYL